MTKPVSCTAPATNHRQQILAEGKRRGMVSEPLLCLCLGANGKSAGFTRQERLPSLQLCPLASPRAFPKTEKRFSVAQHRPPDQKNELHISATALKYHSNPRHQQHVPKALTPLHRPEKPTPEDPTYTCSKTSRSRGRTAPSRSFQPLKAVVLGLKG